MEKSQMGTNPPYQPLQFGLDSKAMGAVAVP